jgi:3-methylcrotonyl-CoA carboxylase beta subunit
MENRLPIVYLVDSAGVFLPMQDEIFPDKEHFGAFSATMPSCHPWASRRFPPSWASCVAGGAYLPIMSDEAMIVEETGSVFLAGSHLVKAAIGEEIDNETLGGANVHSSVSGVTDYRMPDDASCLGGIRDLVSKLGARPRAGLVV